MNKAFLAFLIILTFGLYNGLYSQSLRNREVALITFNYTLNQQVKTKLDEVSHYFPEVDDRKADKFIATLKDKSWFLLEEKVEEAVGVYILPLNTFGNSFTYDQYGYPNVNINRALRVGTSRFYLRADLIFSQFTPPKEIGFGSSSKTREEESETSETSTANGFIPEITINLNFFSDKGIIPILKVSGTARATEPWEIGSNILVGLTDNEPYKENDTSTIMGLTHEAIKNLIANFPPQR